MASQGLNELRHQGTVFKIVCLFSLSWKTTCLQWPHHSVVALYGFAYVYNWYNKPVLLQVIACSKEPTSQSLSWLQPISMPSDNTRLLGGKTIIFFNLFLSQWYIPSKLKMLSSGGCTGRPASRARMVAMSPLCVAQCSGVLPLRSVRVWSAPAQLSARTA